MRIRIVGMHFHPPANEIVKVLPGGMSCTLVSEPLNAYDSNAIRVLIDLREYPQDLHDKLDEALARRGWSAEEITSYAAPLWLGYLARPNPEKGIPIGNSDLIEAIGEDALANGVVGTIGFDSAGKPYVEINEDDPIQATDMEWLNSEVLNP